MTDGLFRESVRGVPALSDGKYDDVNIEEQLVDSAVYRYVQSRFKEKKFKLHPSRLFREPQ